MSKKEVNQKHAPQFIAEIKPLKTNSISMKNRLLAYARGIKQLAREKEE